MTNVWRGEPVALIIYVNVSNVNAVDYKKKEQIVRTAMASIILVVIHHRPGH
jgi:hypothetical protein